MRNPLLNFIATITLALILSQFIPWWSVMLASLLTGAAIPLKKGAVFLTPFLAIFIFWSIYAWLLSSANDFILAKKIAVLLPLNGNAFLLIIVTGVIGGLAAGTSATLGKQCRTMLSNKD